MMNIKKITANGREIAIVNSNDIIISDVQSALDFIMSVNYETGSHSIVINKEAVIEDFFVLILRFCHTELGSTSHIGVIHWSHSLVETMHFQCKTFSFYKFYHGLKDF